MLGAVDMRTIRRHISDAVAQIEEEAALQLVAVLSQGTGPRRAVPPMRVGEIAGGVSGRGCRAVWSRRRAGGGECTKMFALCARARQVACSKPRAPAPAPLVPPWSCALGRRFHDRRV